MSDRIYRVVITGYVMQKDYMDEPDKWDWTNSSTYMGLFLDTPDVTVTELKETLLNPFEVANEI